MTTAYTVAFKTPTGRIRSYFAGYGPVEIFGTQYPEYGTEPKWTEDVRYAAVTDKAEAERLAQALNDGSDFLERDDWSERYYHSVVEVRV